MKVCVIGGAGYVGLVTGLGLSHLGHSVISVDVDMDRVSQLQDGRCHLLEPGAGQLLNEKIKHRESFRPFAPSISDSLLT